jgi:hypothetical protein
MNELSMYLTVKETRVSGVRTLSPQTGWRLHTGKLLWGAVEVTTNKIQVDRIVCCGPGYVQECPFLENKLPAA